MDKPPSTNVATGASRPANIRTHYLIDARTAEFLSIDGCSGKLDFGINFLLGDRIAFNAGPQASQQFLKALIPRWWLNRPSDDFSLLRPQLMDNSQNLIKGQVELDLLRNHLRHKYHLPKPIILQLTTHGKRGLLRFELRAPLFANSLQICYTSVRTT